MRFLGVLFVALILVAAVGLFRGWFTLTTHAAGADVTVGVDGAKVGSDAAAAKAEVGALAREVVESVKALGRPAGADASVLDVTVTAVDAAARHITVTAGERTLDFVVPIAVTPRRNGVAIGFAQLLPTTKAKLTFQHTGDDRHLTQIEVL